MPQKRVSKQHPASSNKSKRRDSQEHGVCFFIISSSSESRRYPIATDTKQIFAHGRGFVFYLIKPNALHTFLRHHTLKRRTSQRIPTLNPKLFLLLLHNRNSILVKLRYHSIFVEEPYFVKGRLLYSTIFFGGCFHAPYQGYLAVWRTLRF